MVSEELLPERKDYESPLCVEKNEEQVLSESFNELNAIARGVEKQFDLLLGLSKIVTEKTIDIGRRLDIPEKETQRWAVERSILDSERNTIIQTLAK